MGDAEEPGPIDRRLSDQGQSDDRGAQRFHGGEDTAAGHIAAAATRQLRLSSGVGQKTEHNLT
jgi:hypothetical protein